MPRNNVRLGQHFLVDQVILQHIVQIIVEQPGDALVEIGPGEAALTRPLLARGHTISAIELDRALCEKLRDMHPKLQITHADALRCDFSKLPAFQQQSVCLFGNLPYQISALLMIKLFDYRDAVKSMTFMVQQEVAERIIARPKTRNYGRLSVMVQAWCQARIVLTVPPDAFSPPPKVMSSVFVARPVERPACTDLDWLLFAKVVARAFQHKRKQCFGSFKQVLGQADWQALGFAQTARPTDLSVPDYIALTKWLGAHSHISDIAR